MRNLSLVWCLLLVAGCAEEAAGPMAVDAGVDEGSGTGSGEGSGSGAGSLPGETFAAAAAASMLFVSSAQCGIISRRFPSAASFDTAARDKLTMMLGDAADDAAPPADFCAVAAFSASLCSIAYSAFTRRRPGSSVAATL